MRESFILYTKFYTAIRTLSDEQLGRLFRAIFEYETDGTENTQPDIGMAFAFIKNQLDLNNKKYQKTCENRKKASQARWDKYRQVMQMHAFDTSDTIKGDNENENDNDNDNDNENENDLNNTPPSPAGLYGSYGNVVLSDSEFSILKQKFPRDFERRINDLSVYMEISGKTYKNHMAVILKWAAEDEAKRGTGKPAKGYTFTNIDNHSYTEQDYNAMFDNFGMEERENI